jgi:hypothetical protein
VLQAVRAVVENMASSITAIKRFMWDLLAKSDMDMDIDQDWPTARTGTVRAAM